MALSRVNVELTLRAYLEASSNIDSSISAAWTQIWGLRPSNLSVHVEHLAIVAGDTLIITSISYPRLLIIYRWLFSLVSQARSYQIRDTHSGLRPQMSVVRHSMYFKSKSKSRSKSATYTYWSSRDFLPNFSHGGTVRNSNIYKREKPRSTSIVKELGTRDSKSYTRVE